MNCFVTLFWPTKHIVWNTFDRRRNIEFRKHLSTLVAYAKRHKIKRIILFIDHASYHDTDEVKEFFNQHPLFKVKRFGKKDPNSNAVELLVNKRLSNAVNVNRPNENIAQLKQRTKNFSDIITNIMQLSLNHHSCYHNISVVPTGHWTTPPRIYIPLQQILIHEPHFIIQRKPAERTSADIWR